MSLFDKNKEILDNAIQANQARTFFAQYPEHPSPKIYGETADADGRKAFESTLNSNYEELLQEEPAGWLGQEESPYTQQPLGIKYPSFSTDTLISRGNAAFHAWRKVSVNDRAGVLVESLEQVKGRFFDVAYATMHTSGQGYMMSFQASGPHAADRALEAVAMAYAEVTRFPEKAHWHKPMGKVALHMDKEWRAVPKGIGVVIGCSTFPTWNSVTGIYANLMAGNSVIVKPHPGAILPIAIYVAEIQKVLAANGYDPNTCQLAADTFDNMITKELAEHPQVKLIDYTGNSEFGSYLEGLPGKVVFTEKTGVNSVILDSVDDVDAVAQNLAFSVSLYSGQMCTAPQNFYIPKDGIKTKEGVVSLEEFAEKLGKQITGLATHPKAGPVVLGAIQNPKTAARVQEAKNLGGKVLLESQPIENPMFKEARTASPTLIEVDATQAEIFNQELFGPIVLLIKVNDTDHALALASDMAERSGALSCGAYSTDAATKEKIGDTMALAATPVSFNLVGQVYLNQNAAFSDFHVTGGNPAGNASFTDSSYVNRRFTWVGLREPAMA